MKSASAFSGESLATPVEVAAFLGGDFSEKTLANWRSQGKGPRFVKLGGGRIRYDWADVQGWVNEQRRVEA